MGPLVWVGEETLLHELFDRDRLFLVGTLESAISGTSGTEQGREELLQERVWLRLSVEVLIWLEK